MFVSNERYDLILACKCKLNWQPAPAVAGAAALYLQEKPTASPTEIMSELTDRATVGKITNVGPLSPNKLLYTLNKEVPPPTTLPPPNTSTPITVPEEWKLACIDLGGQKGMLELNED